MPVAIENNIGDSSGQYRFKKNTPLQIIHGQFIKI